MHRQTFALLAALLVTAPAVAQQIPSPEVSHFILDNGLELVVIPDRRAPVVTHMVWYRTGAADDPAGQSGVAHFLEHLMFKGTAKYPAGTLEGMVNELGGETNAFTTADVTVYFQTVPPDALADMMDIEADRMRNLVLAPEVIDAERAVILDERRQRVEAQPGSILAEQVTATLYQNHPYRIPVIGWAHEIETLSREDALTFYDRYYAPNNALVIVAGDVDAEEVKAMAEASYGGRAFATGTFTVFGTPRPGTTLADLEKAVMAEVDNLINGDISEAELERAKTRYIRSTIFARDDQAAMAQTYGVWLTTDRSIEDVALWPDHIRAVTAEDVKAVAIKYLRPSIAVTGYLLPPAEETKP